MKLFCKDGKINTIAKDNHKNVEGFEVLNVPDSFDIVESELETEEGLKTTYKSVEQIKTEIAAL